MSRKGMEGSDTVPKAREAERGGRAESRRRIVTRVSRFGAPETARVRAVEGRRTLMISDRSWLISAWKANVSVSSAMVVGGGSNGCPGAALRKSGEEEPQVENKSVSHDEHRRRRRAGADFFFRPEVPGQVWQVMGIAAETRVFF